MRRRKLFLWLSVIVNISVLGFFKYFNFFSSSFQALLGYFGFSPGETLLKVILPVGISFYTFQTMSYTIDVYRKQLQPTRRFFDYALFVAFFPQLVAGPIMRGTSLLPQVLKPRKLSLEKFYAGCYLIFWGLVLKIVIADNLAKVVEPVFAGRPPYNGASVVFAVYAFAFQVFGDFAGYSNIARGLGKLMGFDIMVNFNLPYFATNPREFWNRWHISLSTWLKDYLYISMGGNRKGKAKTYRNIFLTMLLGGLWHGAAWTYVIWGAYQGVLMMVYRLLEGSFERLKWTRTFLEGRIGYVLRVILFFQLFCFGYIIFRAESMHQAGEMMKAVLFNFRLQGIGSTGEFKALALIGFLLAVQLLQFLRNDLMVVFRGPIPVRAAFYTALYFLVVLFGVTGAKEFIYFQF
jgi:D-alanyl-lipoteichoic acid acyltransferase DltB (MBOAT superfamily)